MKISRSLFATTLSSVLLTGCSFLGGSDEIEPAKLENIDQQFELSSVWSVKAVSNNKEYWPNLRMAVSDSLLFAADHGGSVVALDVQTGKQQWSVDLDLSVSGGVGYGAQKLVLGTIEGQIYALNAKDGSVLWSSSVSSEVLSSPAVNQKIVVAQSIDNRLYAFDAQTGKELWQHDAGAPILSVRGNSSSMILNNIVIAAFDNGKLIAFNTENGSLVWETRLALPKGRTELERMIDVDGEPILVGDIIYSVSYQGRLGALTRGTGRNLWFQDSSSHYSPAFSDGKLFVTEAKNDAVRAFKAGNGQEIWENNQLQYRELTGPVSFGDSIAVADAEGYLHLLNTETGVFMGRTKVGGSGVSTPIIVIGETLLVQANNGSISAYKIQ
ncbi:MAG: outer membrane protein assembly factor BamB [Porticoccaceae bacterium]|nr:outer membrane protein assembly factor BamB [Porticoccaceae bacterium]